MSTQVHKPLISFDYAIKYVLRDKADYKIIESFLSALLETANYKPVKIKTLLESESNTDERRGKRIVADMIVEDTDGVQYIVEIERNEKYNVMHKACFSTARTIVDSVGQGDDYSKVVKVLHISLLYFDIGGGSIYHGKTIMHDVTSGERLQLHLHNKDGVQYDLVDILPEYFVISIPAFHDEVKRGIDEWLYMMKHEAIKASFKNPYIKQAAERLSYLKMDMTERAQYERYQIEMVDIREELHTQLIKGIAQGKAEGIAQGEFNAKCALAKKMKANNYAIAAIMALTDLSAAEISQLD